MQRIVFYLDNDRAGRSATEAIRMVFPEKYDTEDILPPKGSVSKEKNRDRQAITANASREIKTPPGFSWIMGM